MADPTLARPTWRIGQVLLPDHLVGLEAALSAEAALRAGLSGPPAYGVARLEWNGDAPTGGVLWVSALTAVLPGGMLVDVPGNARVRGPLDLKTAGRGEIDVFAHVAEDEDPGQALMDPPSPKEIHRQIHVVELSTDPGRRGSRGRIVLGRFARGPGGVGFQLSPRVVPPLLRLDATPYLAGPLRRLRDEIGVLEQALDDRAIDALGRGEALGPIQRARLEARKAAALLDDVLGGVPLHPYWIYSALRAFSLDLYQLDERATPWQPPPYAHDDPALCFGAVLAEISGRIQVAPPSTPVVPFVLDNGRLVAADLLPEALTAPEVYVVVLKARASDQVPLESVRFASPGRLRLVREHALRGVRLVAVSGPPFRHGFGSAVDFYRLATTGAAGEPGEWAYVVQERAIACHATPALEGHRLVLCWRRP